MTGAAWRFEAHTRTADYLRGRRASRQLVAHHTERSARDGDEVAVATLVDAGVAFTHEGRPAACRGGDVVRPALGRSGELARSREVLQRLRRADGPVRRRAETFSVAVARQLGDFAEAAATLGTQLRRGGLDPVEEAKLHVELAAVDAFREEPTSAVHHAQRALELLDEHRSALVAAALTLRALATLYLGCARSAREQLADAVVAVDATGDADLRPYVEIVSPLALVEIQLGNYADADRHLARARRILDGLGPSSASPYLLVMESLVHARAGRLTRAVRRRAGGQHGDGREWRRGPPAPGVRLGGDPGSVGTEVIVGSPAPEHGGGSTGWNWLARASRATGARADLLTEPATPPSRHPPVLVARDVVATVVAAGQGDHATAARFGRRAERRAATADLPYEIGLARFARAFAAYRMADPDRATVLAEHAAASFVTAGTPMEEALSRHLAGVAYLVAGRPGPGAAAFDRADTGYRACGAVWAAAAGTAPSPPGSGRSRAWRRPA